MSDSFNPYESPQAITPEVVTGPSGLIPFESGHKRAVWTLGLLGLGILIEVISTVSFYAQYQLLDQARMGHFATPEAAHAMIIRQQFIAMLHLAVLVCTGIVFLMWTHRASRNLRSFGVLGLKFTPGWAVGWYFVPFANLVRPCEAMVEIGRGSDPSQGRAGTSAWRRPETPPIIGWWWAGWILANVIGYLAMQWPTRDTNELDRALSLTMCAIIENVAFVVASVLAIVLVQTIDANQTLRNRLLSESDGSTSALSPP